MPAGDPLPANTTEEFERALERLGTEQFVLRLYVAGNSLRSQTAIENVRKICDEYLHDRCELEVIDIYQDPTMVPEDLVLAAPTLIRRLPLPLRRVIGDLSAKEKVLVGLDLIPKT
ncbi:MAG: circadian clock KaiB family protein [Methanospirillum sp.]